MLKNEMPKYLNYHKCMRVYLNGYNIGANQAGKQAQSLFNCISVTNDIKYNEQKKSIGKGPLYQQTKFEAISVLLWKVMAGLNRKGYPTLHGESVRLKTEFYHKK